MSASTIETPALPETQVPAADSAVAQVNRALENKGDNVRASWNFNLPAVREGIAHMSPEAKELLVWCFLWCIDDAHPIHRQDFCDRVKYSMNTIYKIYSGKYRTPDEHKRLMDCPADLVKAMREFRRLELVRAKGGSKTFVMTPTAKRIYWAIDQARKMRRPIMVVGGSQIGKTEACRQNTIDFNHGKTILIEIEAVNGLRGLLQAIAAKLGISPNTSTPALIESIKDAITSDMVLILDEVHLLANVYRAGSFFACMEQIRRIWDAKKFGLVLTFTDLGYEKTQETRKRELSQIFRRSLDPVNLGPAPKQADVKAICTHAGLDWHDVYEPIVIDKIVERPRDALKQLAEERGMDAICVRIHKARELAADEDRKEISWSDFITAHFMLVREGQAPKSDW